MAVNVFVCFDHTDQKQVEAFNALKSASKHTLDTHDYLIRQASADGVEQSIPCRFNDAHAKAIRDEITTKFEQCAKLVVLISAETHKNAWIDWKINTFHKMKDARAPGKAWTRIRAISLEGCEKAPAPKALECRSTKRLSWDPETLEKWLEEEPVV